MIDTRMTESAVEQAALEWLHFLGYTIAYGPMIAAGEAKAERIDPNYRDVILARRLRQAIMSLNPDLPVAAIEDAYRKLTRIDAPVLVNRNKDFHRMLVEGVAVEYARKDGSIAGTQVRLFDCENPERNDWLAVNQFTVC